MTHVTATMDFWSLAWPRFVQGFSMGFIFVPLQALALATIPTRATGQRDRRLQRACATSAAASGVAVATTLLARRSQEHQATLVGHLNAWNPAMAERLQDWTDHFVSHGADTFTAGRRAMAMLYRETVSCRPRCSSYADDFWLLLVVLLAVLVLVPFMRRVRADAARRRGQGPA